MPSYLPPIPWTLQRMKSFTPLPWKYAVRRSDAHIRPPNSQPTLQSPFSRYLLPRRFILSLLQDGLGRSSRISWRLSCARMKAILLIKSTFRVVLPSVRGRGEERTKSTRRTSTCARACRSRQEGQREGQARTEEYLGELFREEREGKGRGCVNIEVPDASLISPAEPACR